jgi:hypothetical protein
MRFVFLFFSTLVIGTVSAQSSSDSVRQVVNDFFVAMKRSYTSGMRACMSPVVHFEATQSQPDAVPTLIQVSVNAFLASVARIEPGLLDERIQFASVLVEGSLASVWTPYEFYFNGRYSHCGVNSFQLVRLRGKWQIQYLIDTRHKSCSPELK